MESIFEGWGDIVKKRFELSRNDESVGMYIMYVDGLADNEMVERTITRPLLYEWRDREMGEGDMHLDERFGEMISQEESKTSIVEEDALKIVKKHSIMPSEFERIFHEETEAWT